LNRYNNKNMVKSVHGIDDAVVIVKKALFLGVLLVSSGLVFVGCSGNKTPVTLRVLNYLDKSSPGAAAEIARVWEAFEAANPDIVLVREDLYSEPYFNKLEAYINEDRLPDVVLTWPTGRSSVLLTQRLLKDLAPLIKKDTLAASYSAAALDPHWQDGYLGFLPRSMGSSHALYCNTAVLRDAGLSTAETYGELKAQVPLLREKGYDTVIMGNQDTRVLQYSLFSLIAGRFCGQGWERRMLSGEAQFTDKDFLSALDFVGTLYHDGVISRNTLGINYHEVIRRFAEGNAAYLIDTPQRASALIAPSSGRSSAEAGAGSTGEAAFPPERQGDIKLTVFPGIEGVRFNRSTSLILGPGWGINAKIPPQSAEEKAAWRLVKWLSGRTVQTWLLESGGIATPTRIDIDENSLELAPLRKELAGMVRKYNTGTAVIGTAFPVEVTTPINDGLTELGMGTKTPQQAAEMIQRGYERWKGKQ
jgi:raffinose/stachyose/melibiose transport system substrate-binding protein